MRTISETNTLTENNNGFIAQQVLKPKEINK